MNPTAPFRRASLVAGVSCLVAACSGSGSDIGPRLEHLPAGGCKVVVLDDAGRSVVGATIALDGSAQRATSGRNGRTDLFGSPRGRHIVHVDGAAAAAVDGDDLGELQFAVTIPGPDLPLPIHLPDLAAAPAVTIAVGTQTAPVPLTSASGGVVTVPAGASVGIGSGASSVALRLGELAPEHLPGDLPAPTTGPVLMGRGFYVSPLGFTCEPAASLDVADDLGLGSAVASLYRLDEVTGAWLVESAVALQVGGRITLANAIARGGLYAFGGAVPSTTMAQGRVVDAAGNGVPGTLVAVDGRPAPVDNTGRFSLAEVAGSRVDGTARDVALEVFAGGIWLPIRLATTAAAAAGGTTDFGDLMLDTMPAGNLRLLQLSRGRVVANRRSTISAANGDVSLAATGDEAGISFFEDVPAGWFGYTEGNAIDRERVYYSDARGYLEPGLRWQDVYQYFDRRSWYVGARRTRAEVIDAVGGGTIRDAALVRGAVPGEGFNGLSSENNLYFIERDFSGRATAVLGSDRYGQRIVHAFTVEAPNGEHLELPLRRSLRPPLAAFDRHGLVAGTLVGADSGRDHRLRSSRVATAQDWWDQLLTETAVPVRVPMDVDPATTHADFRIGVPVPGGNLAAAELSTTSGTTTLHRLAIAADLVPSEGEVVARDLSLDLAATTTFDAVDALVGVDPRIDVTAMTFALALQQPSGDVVDAVRGIGGNHARLSGTNDLRFDLPALSGDLAGHHWLLCLQGTISDGPATLGYDALVTLPRAADGVPAAPFRLPSFPSIQSPAAGEHVAAGGFTVAFSLPADALYGVLELRREVAGELRLWEVVVPPGSTSFAFVTLPTEVTSPLVAGDYELTLRSFRALAGPVVGSPTAYADLTSYWRSIGAVERGVDAVSRQTITIAID